MMKFKTLSAIAVFTLLIGCASSPREDVTASSLPDWVLTPVVEDGFADTQCMDNVADINILKNKATALARAEITKQLNIQISAMDKTYSNLTEAVSGTAAGSTFESVSKQVTKQKLAGSRAIKVDYVNFPDGKIYLCVMVAFSPKATRQLFEDIITQSGRALSPRSEEVLYQEFKTYKAQQELDKEIQHKTN